MRRWIHRHLGAVTTLIALVGGAVVVDDELAALKSTGAPAPGAQSRVARVSPPAARGTTNPLEAPTGDCEPNAPIAPSEG